MVDAAVVAGTEVAGRLVAEVGGAVEVLAAVEVLGDALVTGWLVVGDELLLHPVIMMARSSKTTMGMSNLFNFFLLKIYMALETKYNALDTHALHYKSFHMQFVLDDNITGFSEYVYDITHIYRQSTFWHGRTGGKVTIGKTR